MNLHLMGGHPRRAHALCQPAFVRQHGALLAVMRAPGAGFGRHASVRRSRVVRAAVIVRAPVMPAGGISSGLWQHGGARVVADFLAACPGCKNRCTCQSPCTKARKFCARIWCVKAGHVQPTSICMLRAQCQRVLRTTTNKGVPHAGGTAGSRSSGREHHHFYLDFQTPAL